jgi:NAD(P)-dependent dehydrogenase (short-subunit alcohol dehydrogenase family)
MKQVEPILVGKTAIVTGAARGLGLTTAEAYLRAGANVAIFDRNRPQLEAAAEEMSGLRFEPLTVAMDIRDENAIDEAVRQVLTAYGCIDVLVNNAALLMRWVTPEGGERPTFWEIDADRWRELVDVNVTGTWQCAKRVAMEMMAQRSGSIVNIITSARTQISRVHIPYGPSKSFIESFTKAGAEQLKPHGVRMNALMPGGSANRRGESEPDSNPYDVMVPAALFLASDAAKDVSGETFIADQWNKERGLQL